MASASLRRSAGTSRSAGPAAPRAGATGSWASCAGLYAKLGPVPTAYVVLLVSNLIFATGYSISRILLEEISPVTLAMARLTIGSLILVPWAWRGMKAAKLSREGHWRLGLTGGVGFTLAFALGNWGLAHSPPSNPGFLIPVGPAPRIP